MNNRVETSKKISVSPQKVWEIISNLEAMGDLSPENNGGRWENGVSGIEEGAIFKGKNQNGDPTPGGRAHGVRLPTHPGNPVRDCFVHRGFSPIPGGRGGHYLGPDPRGDRRSSPTAWVPGRLGIPLGGGQFLPYWPQRHEHGRPVD